MADVAERMIAQQTGQTSMGFLRRRIRCESQFRENAASCVTAPTRNTFE